jgi:hypothetical protein
MPPVKAAPSHTGNPAGSAAKLIEVPANPAIELTRMNTAETPEVMRVRAHPVNSRNSAA